MGFYSMLNDTVKHSSKSSSIVNSTWKVFQILLEYCCKTNYLQVIQKVTEQHADDLLGIEVKFEKRI
jgi:hypothetical protein